MNPLASHSCHLLQQLHEQRIQGLLCDCMLVVKGVCFKAHKNVLAAFSQYFRSLFQNSSGQKSDIFHLDIKNVGGIGQILDFMYTSHLDLNQDNVQNLLEIAQCLQVQNVLNMCYTFLKSSSSVTDPTSSLLNNGGFSLHGTVTTGTECILSENYTSELLGHCPVDTASQISKETEIRHSNSLRQEAVSNQQVSNVQKHASDLLDRNSSGPPFKQTGIHYKPRNFYSKQFFKQNADTSQERAPEQLTFNISADLNPSSTTECTANGAVCLSDSQEHLPVTPTLSESLNDQNSECTVPQANEQMKLQKPVYLKKFNYLRAQRSPQEPAFQSQQVENSSAEKVLESVLYENPVENQEVTTNDEKESGLEQLTSDDLEKSNSIPASQANSTSKHEDPLVSFHSQKHYCCKMCMKSFKHPSNLELHKRCHTGEKPFECSICGKHFSQAGNLQTHLRRHSGEKPFICEICGKRFAASGDVQRHIIIHTGTKPHLCDTCGRGFSNFSNLKEHKKTHTTDQVYTCDECGKSFNMQRKLVKHRIRHTGDRPYSCSTCGNKFAGSGDLRRHVRTHTGERPYTCDLCGKCFTRSAVLRRHKKMHCKDSEDGQSTVEVITHAIENSYCRPALQKSHSSESFDQDMPVTLSEKLSAHQPDTPASEEFHSCSSSPYSKFGVSVQDVKTNIDSSKVSKPQTDTASQQSYSYRSMHSPAAEEPLPSQNISLMRSSISSLDSQCGEPLGSHTTCKNNDGPFFSSVALWGLAMKTLQSDSEID
ncbi:zinc finger and BTB domain-containing protein 49 [Protopterus annectens]|uniref:zinc finger and BTB domain-containing protein 49 n=1 Tax=Protopterus annectens TaxID=7888 RepID=UPI001CFAF97B|nr:zinc finger and BTB domain-containing protein 49 [Protopterus annectens]